MEIYTNYYWILKTIQKKNYTKVPLIYGLIGISEANNSLPRHLFQLFLVAFVVSDKTLAQPICQSLAVVTENKPLLVETVLYVA